jgi:hypothetical protein
LERPPADAEARRGWILVLVSGISSHFLLRRIIQKSSLLTLKICVPPALLLLNIVLFLAIPAGIGAYYNDHYGYQLQPGEAPGPMSSESDLLIMLLLLFDLLLLCGYTLYLVSLFFRWLHGSRAEAVS